MATKKRKHRGTPASKPAAVEVYQSVEVAMRKIREAFASDGTELVEPFEYCLRVVSDKELDPALRAATSVKLLPYLYVEKSVAVRAADGNPDPVMVTITRYAQAALPAPAINPDARDQAILDGILARDRARATPDPITPAAIDRTRATGAEIFEMRKGPDGIEKPQATGIAIGGYYEMRRGDDGIERPVQVDAPPRVYHGEPDGPKVESEFEP